MGADAHSRRPRRALRRAVVVVAGLGCAASWAGAGRGAERGPLSPEAALASFVLEPGYRIELAAAEPLIRDPVAMSFDERGRLYVVEGRGYPGPLEGGDPGVPLGTIALLEDRDRDGRFDTRTDFADKLPFPNGVMPWAGGVFVSCAPDLLYLKDTTGDGIADERRVVLAGFDASKTAQIRFSHPTLGIDNWVYLTSGLTGGVVTAPDHPDRPPVRMAGSDARFNPFTLAFETTGGPGQYGLTFDDHGRRFICSNRHPVLHAVLEPRHLQRNPHLGFSRTVHEVSTVGAQAAVWPISADTTTASFHPDLIGTPHAGTFTAASGLHIHRGDALPARDRDSLFVCESAQNLVQRQVRTRAGVTFRSRPARPGREFLASADTWFRPVFAAGGPDGALYIVDMYRKIIDHPQYVPEPSRAGLDFQAGGDRGRIYRIMASGATPARTPVRLDLMDPAELARTLEHPNAWWRETAQRLIVAGRERRAEPALRAIAAGSRRDTARLHALWTLDGLGTLTPAEVGAALRDVHPGVRENAARLAGPRLRTAALLPDLMRAAGDADDRVRLAAALALGESDDPRALEALAALARRDGGDAWMRAAILSSVRERSAAFLARFAAAPAASIPIRAAVMQDLAQLFGAGETPERCLDLILQIAGADEETSWQPAALAGLADGLKARGLAADGRSALGSLLARDAPAARRAKPRVDALMARAAALALDPRAPGDLRLASIRLLGHTDRETAASALDRLLAPHQPSEIQVAAVRALSQLPDPAAAGGLLAAARWLGFTPHVREAVLSAMLEDDERTTLVLDAVERGELAPAALNPSRRRRLMAHRDAAIAGRARTLLASAGPVDRMAVYERMRPAVLARDGRPRAGKDAFASFCASCHAFDGAGGGLGPDLSGIRNQPAEAILLHVLVPEYEITPGYQAYVVETRDGRTIAGRLESEAPNSLTLRDSDSRAHVILRSQVVAMAASATSLMPSELERAMSEEALADLIAYLKTSPAAPGGGRPRHRRVRGRRPTGPAASTDGDAA